MIRRIVRALAAWIVANAPRSPLVACGNCGTKNEPWRTSCIGCGRSM